MKKVISAILLSAMLLTLGACASGGGSTTPEITTEGGTSLTTPEDTTAGATTDETTTAASTTEGKDENTVLDKSKEYSVLFIGNSYTIHNSLHTLFKNVASSAGYKVNTTAVLKSSWYLAYHADENDVNGKLVDAALKANKYDFVVMQEQSTCPVLNPGKFYDGARALVAKVRANGATPIFYETWGRKTGHKVLSENGLTNETMTWKLAAAYNAIGKELDVDVAYAGLAFYDVYTNNAKDVDLYNADLTHPSYSGSFLVALTLFSEIFGESPDAVSFKGSLNDDVIAILKAAAKKAVFDTPAIPAEYATKSEGVVAPKYEYTVDSSQMVNLTSVPSSNKLISVLKGGTYPNGKTFSGILGTKNAIASTEYSVSGLSDAQKADIADIGYGVSVIGIEKMFSSSKGYTTAVENLVNGHWGTSFMGCFEFDGKKYDINGKENAEGKYIGLITLNFGSKYKFDAYGFSSGSLQGFPGVAEVYVSDDGVNWEIVPTACWDQVGGKTLVSAGKTPADPWNGNSGAVTCLFDMNQTSGQYIRLGIVIGRNDEESKYNTINTREILVYGEKIS